MHIVFNWTAWKNANIWCVVFKNMSYPAIRTRYQLLKSFCAVSVLLCGHGNSKYDSNNWSLLHSEFKRHCPTIAQLKVQWHPWALFWSNSKVKKPKSNSAHFSHWKSGLSGNKIAVRVRKGRSRNSEDVSSMLGKIYRIHCQQHGWLLRCWVQTEHRKVVCINWWNIRTRIVPGTTILHAK